MDKAIKVLVVDDEDDFRQVMTVWLKSKGYSVIGASNGKDAVQTVKEESPDIIFLDLRMPVMDGNKTIKEIRRFNKNIPIIVISAYVGDLKIKEIKTSDISGVFFKNEDFEKGLSLLESVLRMNKKIR